MAGLTNLNDYWEITNYVNKTLKDFKISKLEGKTAVIAYTFVIVKEFLTGKISQEKMLGDIHQLCIAWDYLEEIFDFYLLWNAVDDLRYDNVQYYWPDATRENIDIVIQEEAKKWLEKYKGRICQQELTVLSKISQDMNIT